MAVYNVFMAEEKKEEEGNQKLTVHVGGEDKPERKIPFRVILIYTLLLASGLFIGILFAYVFRS